MKVIVTIARVITGLLFIFSGLVKAIDPRGLAYKMEEFFEVWGQSGFLKGLMDNLMHYSLAFSISMITLEVVLGLALLIGWKKKITSWLILMLILFFTFLTAFVLFSGKIRACGCFGDCIPLTPVQTFSKDIILLVLAIILVVWSGYIKPVAKPFFSFLYVAIALAATLALQFYVLKHLPLVDCLPYKKGNDILKLREMPADAIQDKYDYVFVYEKGGEKKDFQVSALPDSTWKFVERKQTLVEKGKNNIPLINDFSLSDEAGNDVTVEILSNSDYYYLLFIKDVPEAGDSWITACKAISSNAAAGIKKFYVITAQRDPVRKFLSMNDIKADAIFTSDATAIKTASRANPTLFKMKGAVVEEKWGWADFDKAAR